jgi:hypothetical protein
MRVLIIALGSINKIIQLINLSHIIMSMDKTHSLPRFTSSAVIQELNNKQKKWSAYEYTQFLKLHELYSNHWLQMSHIIQSKSEHDIKNHFYSLLRKCITKITTQNYQFEGHLDLIQCYYISQHIVGFLTQSQSSSKKEYLSTLITLKKVTEEQSVGYFSKLCLMFPFIKKVGWSNYLKEMNEFSEIQIRGFGFPNRILPQVSLSKGVNSLSSEEKSSLMEVWAISLVASRDK